jgi:hypothetical protein
VSRRRRLFPQLRLWIGQVFAAGAPARAMRRIAHARAGVRSPFLRVALGICRVAGCARMRKCDCARVLRARIKRAKHSRFLSGRRFA